MMKRKVIVAERSGFLSYLKRVIEYRRLILLFARRDLQAQYAQSILGLFWAVIKPMIGLAIFTLFFDGFIDLGDKVSVAYPLFAFTGMISWYYFTFLLAHAGTAVLNSQHIITKVYFPKLILPLSKVLVGLVELGISLAVLLVLMAWWGEFPDWRVVWLPVFLVANVLVGLTIGIWLAALTTRYRDFHHIIPYMVNFLIWLTPVFYPATIIPGQYAQWLYLNPMAGVIAGFRWCLLGDAMPSPWYLLSIGAMGLLMLGGLAYFIRVERTMADKV